jgi:Domain of unknown function (DUF5666)
MRSARSTAAVLAVTAAWLAGCGTSSHSNTGQPPETPSPRTSAPSSAPVPLPPATPPSQGKDHVEGMVNSASNGVIALRTRGGSATVDFTPSTIVTEGGPAKLTDVTAGSCVSVHAAPDGPPGSMTAQSVIVSPTVAGTCLPPPEANSGGAPPAGPPPAKPTGLFGQVASVSGDTVVVNTPGPDGRIGPANVIVNDATTYSKDTATNDQAIVNGKCLAAQGTQGNGALQATAISLQPCPPMGGGHHFHLPHLPIHLPLHHHH